MERAEDAEGVAWLKVEEGCQEEAQKKKAEKKRRYTRTAKKEESGVKSSKKWLQTD